MDDEAALRLLEALVRPVATRRRIPVEELFQEVSVRLLNRKVAVAALVRGGGKAYLVKAIHNAANDMYRAENRIRVHESPDSDKIEGVASPTPRSAHTVSALQNCIDWNLPAPLLAAVLNGDPLGSEAERVAAAALFLVTQRRTFTRPQERFNSHAFDVLEGVARGALFSAAREQIRGRVETRREALEVAIAARCAVDSVLFWGTIRRMKRLLRRYCEGLYETPDLGPTRHDTTLDEVRSALTALNLGANMSEGEYRFYQWFVLANDDLAGKYRAWAASLHDDAARRLRESVWRRLPDPDLIERIFD